MIKQEIHNISQLLGVQPGEDETSGIEVNTVDAYQGREKDIIIISTVRTEELGFLNDYRRMNVAITRAKHFMWIVGNSKSLSKSTKWKAILDSGV